MISSQLKQIQAGVLSVAYEEYGAALAGEPSNKHVPAVVLLHGFPYDPHAFDAVSARLSAAGLRVLVPYLRGYGPTRFLRAETPRSGQQAVLGGDLLAFMNALNLERALLAGFDWGGRAACIVAALWPERVTGLVTVGGYNIQDLAHCAEPLSPQAEHRFWYQYYLHGERGRAGLTQHRSAFCKLLWQQWSPNWRFDDATFEQTARSFENPDFVDVVVHSYRHRFGLVAGDPAVEPIEQRLLARPSISVPTINLDGAADGVMPPEGSASHAKFFSGPYERRVVPVAGHNPAQEAPEAFAVAVLQLV